MILALDRAGYVEPSAGIEESVVNNASDLSWISVRRTLAESVSI
jgi:hypothetical protein